MSGVICFPRMLLSVVQSLVVLMHREEKEKHYINGLTTESILFHFQWQNS